MMPHLLYEDDEITDESFRIGGSDSLLRKRAKTQALIMKHFWVRWKQEYLTLLFIKPLVGMTEMSNVGDVVLVLLDYTRS